MFIMMKKNLLKIKALELNEKDNGFTAFAKGGARGTINTTLINCAIVGVALVIGKYKQNKEVASTEEMSE